MIPNLKPFHEPIAPYHSSTYVALCSIAQAVPVGILFLELTEEKKGARTLSELFKETFTTFSLPALHAAIDLPVRSVAVLFLIAVIWHRYALDNRIVAWPLTPLDTIIPFVFSVLQCFMALAVRWDLTLFTSIVALSTLWAIAAYWQVAEKFLQPHALKLYEEHFKESESKYAERMYYMVASYFCDSVRNSQIAAALFCFLSVLALVSDTYIVSKNLKFFVWLVVMVSMCVTIAVYFRDDLTKRMKRVTREIEQEWLISRQRKQRKTSI